MADTNSTSKFPAAYVNSVSEDDSMIVRVDQNMSEIGTRPVVMPKGMTPEKMSLEHVGGKI